MLSWVAAHWTEILGFGTGLGCVLLAARRNVANFAVGIANNVVFGVLFTRHALYADAGLQVIYLGLAVAGWIGWVRGRAEPAFVRDAPRRAAPGLSAAFAVLTAVLWWVLTAHTDSTTQLADAATTAASLVAQYMLNRRWLQNWFVWIAVDVVYVGAYLFKSLHVTAALYVFFLGLAVIGLRAWSAAAHTPTAEPAAHGAR